MKQVRKKWKKQKGHIRRNPTPQNRSRASMPWTADEENLIMMVHRPSDKVLSEDLGRSVKAIRRKREKLMGV